MANEFESVRKLCRWIDSELDKFENATTEFLAKNKPAIIREYDPATDTYSFYPDIAGRQDDFDDFEKSAYTIVNDLRNVLDQACYAACIRLGTSHETKTNFPVAFDDADFDKRVSNSKGTYKGIPAALYTELKSFEPFWEYKDGRDGDHRLRGLLEFANQNKHRVPLRVQSDLGLAVREMVGMRMTQEVIEREGEPDLPMLRLQKMEPGARASLQFNQEFYLADNGALGAQDAVTTFRDLKDIVFNIVDRLDDFTK